jgi:hypothetical protein
MLPALSRAWIDSWLAPRGSTMSALKEVPPATGGPRPRSTPHAVDLRQVVLRGTAARRRSKATGNSPSAIVSDLVLSKSGSFAWIGSGPAGNEVHRFDVGDAGDTVVDSGPDVQAGSLALAGSTIHWTKADKPASAPIK